MANFSSITTTALLSLSSLTFAADKTDKDSALRETSSKGIADIAGKPTTPAPIAEAPIRFETLLAKVEVEGLVESLRTNGYKVEAGKDGKSFTAVSPDGKTIGLSYSEATENCNGGRIGLTYSDPASSYTLDMKLTNAGGVNTVLYSISCITPRPFGLGQFGDVNSNFLGVVTGPLQLATYSGGLGFATHVNGKPAIVAAEGLIHAPESAPIDAHSNFTFPLSGIEFENGSLNIHPLIPMAPAAPISPAQSSSPYPSNVHVGQNANVHIGNITVSPDSNVQMGTFNGK